MAVKRKLYSQALEEALAKGMTTTKAQSHAMVASSTSEEDVKARTYHKASGTDKFLLKMLKKLKGKSVKQKGKEQLQSQAKKHYGTDLESELAKLRKKGGG